MLLVLINLVTLCYVNYLLKKLKLCYMKLYITKSLGVDRQRMIDSLRGELRRSRIKHGE